MAKQNYGILSIIVIVLLGGIVSGIYFNLPYLWIGGLILLAVTYIYLTSSKTCVKKLLKVAKKFKGEEKLSKSYYLLTDKFRKSLKYTLFKDFNPNKISNIYLENKNDISTNFVAELDDNKKYTFYVIKRNKSADGKNVFSWVIDDISGHEFEKSYEEIHGKVSKE
ncbi:hypothetical protein [Sporosalibacterium faouarense]|uniref:hypothetical protein n=1 Tax=Sporosalibacterium faouarense TaxID=516123 RepID=UPI00192B6256|nr:hypothetical protein [Sporosalibacterium faouarense]